MESRHVFQKVIVNFTKKIKTENMLLQPQNFKTIGKSN